MRGLVVALDGCAVAAFVKRNTTIIAMVNRLTLLFKPCAFDFIDFAFEDVIVFFRLTAVFYGIACCVTHLY
jgi:hypothetical protein